MAEQSITIGQTEETANLFGTFDENIRIIERELGLTAVSRDGELKLSGPEEAVAQGAQAIRGLQELAGRGEQLGEQAVRYTLGLVREGKADQIGNYGRDVLCVTAAGKPIRAKTVGQTRYIQAIAHNTITLGVGPAGTGKTYLAVAAAVAAFRARQVNRIILTRPAVEAGERLGFLPGDLQSKVDPYLRPLYDALYDFLGMESFKSLSDRGCIEVAPLAYMRGRTLNDAFIILDEAQNCTVEQMKMFHTRFGEGSKVIVTGDVTQIDLPPDKRSGLIHAANVLKDVEGLEIVRLTHKDVVRHEMVQKIIRAYEKAEAQAAARRAARTAH